LLCNPLLRTTNSWQLKWNYALLWIPADRNDRLMTGGQSRVV
jgi:hypothetical protein